jgi:hypothetical protein
MSATRTIDTAAVPIERLPEASAAVDAARRLAKTTNIFRSLAMRVSLCCAQLDNVAACRIEDAVEKPFPFGESDELFVIVAVTVIDTIYAGLLVRDYQLGFEDRDTCPRQPCPARASQIVELPRLDGPDRCDRFIRPRFEF